ncbi:hypothetical protein V6N13_114394 [Hibiscus sabdariffa]
MALPKRFVTAFGNDVSDSVIVRAATGPEWKVELMKHDGEIWLTNGWKDFVDYFSLKYGSLLIFRYEGRSRFYVLMIFDQTTFEIEYPIGVGDDEVELPTPKVEEVEITTRTEKTPVLCYSPRKRRRTNLSSGMVGTDLFTVLSMSMFTGKTGTKEAGRAMSAAPRTSTSSTANCFRSGNPFFVVNVRKSYINGRDLHIPAAFARNYLAREETKADVVGSEVKANAVLKDRDGRTWPVLLKICKMYRLAQFGYGWTAFASDNGLQVGDSCAFELLEGPEMSFRVTILWKTEDSDRHTAHGSTRGHVRYERELNGRSQFECGYSSKNVVISSSTTNKEFRLLRRKVKAEDGKNDQAMQTFAIQRILNKRIARSVESASELRSDHPFFKVVITASFLQLGYPSIPGQFCDKHMERIPEDATVIFKGKSWPMRIITCSDRAGRFSSGWKAFALENKLRVGDFCVFEMIKKNSVFKVSIFRDGSTLG